MRDACIIVKTAGRFQFRLLDIKSWPLRYMSPEQARAQEVDARSDISSLGAVLYGMIVGEPLFAGETMADIIAAIINREPGPVAEFTRESSISGEDLISNLYCAETSITRVRYKRSPRKIKSRCSMARTRRAFESHGDNRRK